MFASRNIKLCTKDCICLFVCPTGATDTEDGQIDSRMCLDGCRLCVDACPSGAISLVYERYAETRQPKTKVFEHLRTLLETRAHFIDALSTADTKSAAGKVFRDALVHSLEVAAEDYVREMGFMMPQAESLASFQTAESGARLYEKNYGEKTAIDDLISESLRAMENHRDASPRVIQVCADCGYIVLDVKKTTCPKCSVYADAPSSAR